MTNREMQNFYDEKEMSQFQEKMLTFKKLF